MAKEQDKSIEMIVAELEKQFGKGVVTLNQVIPNVEFVTTGCKSIDFALGGGVPRGRIIEVYGPESCLDANTFIQYEVRTSDGKRQNHKGGTIEHLYKRFHNFPREGKGAYPRKETINSEYFVPSVNEEGRIIQNRIQDVVHTGFKECYLLVTTSGHKLEATKEHKFLTPEGYKPLSELMLGDKVFIHNKTPYRKDHKPIRYKEVLVKYHPTWPIKIVNGYLYHRGRVSHAVWEAHQQGMSYDAYISWLNKAEKETINSLFSGIPEGFDIHHIDEDFTNDTLENLALVNKAEHYRFHALKNHNNLRYTVVETKIERLIWVGIKDTYDIRCTSPYNNYVANGIVVHNSGKTTLALHVLAECQKRGEVAAFVDAEHAVDPTYATALGVDLEKLILSQPDSGEQALEIVEALVRSGKVSIVIVDSVSALVPKAEIEGDMGSNHPGLQARLMSQAMRKLTGIVSSTNTILIFINQIRMKIGVVYGNPEVTSGGNALKFYASQRIEIRRGTAIKNGESFLGTETNIKVVKNKVAPPFRKAEVIIRYGEGIDKYADIVKLAVDKDIIKKSGSWYSYKEGQLGQGEEKVITYLKEHLDLFEEIKNQL